MRFNRRSYLPADLPTQVYRTAGGYSRPARKTYGSGQLLRRLSNQAGSVNPAPLADSQAPQAATADAGVPARSLAA